METLNQRIIGLIGAFDSNGVYGIGSHLPWGNEKGGSKIKLDMARFKYVTKEVAPPKKQNVLIVGRGTAEAMGFRPLPGRYMIVLSQTLKEEILNTDLPEGKKIAVARNVQQAVERALQYEDCGNIYFAGGYEVWLQALKSGLCTHAFITEVICDCLAKSPFQGELRRAPEMVRDATYQHHYLEPDKPEEIEDSWDENPVQLKFMTFKKK